MPEKSKNGRRFTLALLALKVTAPIDCDDALGEALCEELECAFEDAIEAIREKMHELYPDVELGYSIADAREIKP